MVHTSAQMQMPVTVSTCTPVNIVKGDQGLSTRWRQRLLNAQSSSMTAAANKVVIHIHVEPHLGAFYHPKCKTDIAVGLYSVIILHAPHRNINSLLSSLALLPRWENLVCLLRKKACFEEDRSQEGEKQSGRNSRQHGDDLNWSTPSSRAHPGKWRTSGGSPLSNTCPTRLPTTAP